MTKKIIFAFSVLALFLFLVQANTRAYTIWYEYLMSNIDSSTEGEIVSIRRDYVGGASRGPGFYRYHFNYIYYIDGSPYVGHVFSHEGLANDEDVTGKYSDSSVITVHYDSERPYYSVVEVRDPGFVMFGAFVPLIVFFLYLLSIIFLRKRGVA